MHLSKRAAIESSISGVGVSTSVRRYFREYYKRQGVDAMSSLRNKEINDIVGADFLKAQMLHKFRLRSGEIAIIKKSHAFYYIGKVRKGSGWDVIVIQPAYKAPSEEVRKKRIEDKGWGGALI